MNASTPGKFLSEPPEIVEMWKVVDQLKEMCFSLLGTADAKDPEKARILGILKELNYVENEGGGSYIISEAGHEFLNLTQNANFMETVAHNVRNNGVSLRVAITYACDIQMESLVLARPQP